MVVTMDHQQITFITLNKFSLATHPLPASPRSSPFLKVGRHINQAGGADAGMEMRVVSIKQKVK